MACLRDLEPDIIPLFESSLQQCNGINGTNNGPFPNSTSTNSTSQSGTAAASVSQTSVQAHSGTGHVSVGVGLVGGFVLFVAVMLGY